MKCTHSTYNKLLLYKTLLHLFVDPNKCWVTCRCAESKYVHVLKSQTAFRGPVFSCMLQRWVAPIRLWCPTIVFLYLCILLRWASSEHTDTTVGCVVSAESVHVDPAETDLATICTYSLLWRPGMWLKINQRPAIIWRCCSSFRGAAEITSLCWLYTGGATDVIHHQAIWDVKVLWIMHVFWLLCLFSNRKPLKSWCSTNIAFLFFPFF